MCIVLTCMALTLAMCIVQTQLQGNRLTDSMLTLAIGIATIPVVIVLIAWSAVGSNFESLLYPNEVYITVIITFDFTKCPYN